MPAEYDFMKSSREKDMSDEEYKTLREEYGKKAAVLSNRIKKIVFTFLGIYSASFIVLYIRLLFSGTDIATSIYILAVEFLLAIFLYDPKAEEDRKTKYETDKRILLNSVKAKIAMSKIRLGLVIGLGVLFLLLNVVWWMVFGFIQSDGETVELLRVIYFKGGCFSFVNPAI